MNISDFKHLAKLHEKIKLSHKLTYSESRPWVRTHFLLKGIELAINAVKQDIDNIDEIEFKKKKREDL